MSSPDKQSKTWPSWEKSEANSFMLEGALVIMNTQLTYDAFQILPIRR